MAQSMKEQFTKESVESKVLDYKDLVHHDFVDMAALLKEGPLAQHRKNWEYCQIYHTLRKMGKLIPGSTGLVFGCGKEKLVSLFANLGCKITATDNVSADNWDSDGQYATNISDLYYSNIISKEKFDANVVFRQEDMNNISDELKQQRFDFIWSVCAFEHLGSIQHGVNFITESSKLLKEGGIACHTTEYNLTSNTDTIEAPNIVVYRQQDILLMKQKLEEMNLVVAPLRLNQSDDYHNKITVPRVLEPGWDKNIEACDCKIWNYHCTLNFGTYDITCFLLVIGNPAIDNKSI